LGAKKGTYGCRSRKSQILNVGKGIMALLEVSGLTKHFGGLAAVSQLDFEVKRFSGIMMQGEA
jgi:hypothetical protein